MMSIRSGERAMRGPGRTGALDEGLETVLTQRAAAYLRAAHDLTGEDGRAAASLAARRALAATPHWRLERAGLAVIEEAARLAAPLKVGAVGALTVLPAQAPQAMPEQNLDRLGLGDFVGGTRRAQRRLRARLRSLGPTPALVAVLMAVLLLTPGLPH
jgi:hypothetical protein